MSKTILVKHICYENSPMMTNDYYKLFEELYEENSKELYEHIMMYAHCSENNSSGDWDRISFLLKQHGWDYLILDDDFDLSVTDGCIWIVEES